MWLYVSYKLLGGYQGDAQEILGQSLITYTTKAGVDAHTLTIKSSLPATAATQAAATIEETIY
jgi:hypothetical protein